MSIIKFPDSVTIRGSGREPDSTWNDVRNSPKIAYSKDKSDLVEISAEAKMKYFQDNLIRLEKVKSLKEAREYAEYLADKIRFKEADLRKVYRLNKITDANNKIKSQFYSENEDKVLRKMIEMPAV
jgi:anti-sigma28 factor (negative regulator of flagellin synthesis)